MRFLTRGRALWAALIAIVGALAVGGAAYAVIPDSTGVIHTCYMKSGGTLRVIDDSVTKCKSSETALPISQTGPPGAPGADGADGVSGYEIVSESDDFASSVSLLLTGRTATCPSGKMALGGGARVGTTDSGGVTTGYLVSQDYPLSDGTGWHADFSVDNSIGEPFTITVFATCANVS